MRGLLTIYRREMAALFWGPLAWVLLTVALLLSGFSFVDDLKRYGGEVTASLQLSLSAWTALLLLPPLLTMRMLSEEARSGMLEFLLTAPIPDWAVIVGKFLAALTFMVLFWSTKLCYALVIQLLGTAPDWTATLGAFVGAVLTSGLFCAIGLLASAVASAPAVAAFLGIVASWMVLQVPAQRGRFASEAWARVVDFFDTRLYYESFVAGIVDTGGVVFFVVWSAMLLFLATRAVESRRWR